MASGEMDALAKWVQENFDSRPQGHKNHIHGADVLSIAAQWVDNAVVAHEQALFEEFEMVRAKAGLTRAQIDDLVFHHGSKDLLEKYTEWRDREV